MKKRYRTDPGWLPDQPIPATLADPGRQDWASGRQTYSSCPGIGLPGALPLAGRIEDSFRRQISDSWSRLTGQPATQLMISLSQTDASDIMEAGLILPEPGQESAWFNQHRDQLSGLAPDGVRGL
jgi:hypothetical protein